MPDWELCRVLGNVIDNAYEAARDQENPFVELVLQENIKDYKIIINNSSDLLEGATLERIFEAGFTTKAEKENHGMGLYIIKTLLNRYDNYIELHYDSGIVHSEIVIHKLLDEK
jgi:two-component system cit operon sensor histidine kinase CitA